MHRYVVLSAGISAFWPVWLVCIGGVALIVIALLALLLLKGEQDAPAVWKLFPAVRNKKDGGAHQGVSAGEPVEVRFYRLGLSTSVKSRQFLPDQWFVVGSDKKADFCLDPEDPRLEPAHFRICIKGTALMVSAMEQETFVNGVPIRQLGTVYAASGDLIRAGGYEYRVMFGDKENTI